MNVVHTFIEHYICFDLEIQSAGRLQSIWFNCIQDAFDIIPHTKMIKRWSFLSFNNEEQYTSICIHEREEN